MKNTKIAAISVIKIIAVVVLISVTQFVSAKTEPAFSGYDLVSYFENDRAEQGDANYSYAYKNKIYQFASDKHLALFKLNPEHYLPQYDGYCAYGMTFGKKFEGDPEAWMIVDGKLYFNLDKSFMKKWSEDVDASILTADDQWEKLKE